jgi:hypothetical protein
VSGVVSLENGCRDAPALRHRETVLGGPLADRAVVALLGAALAAVPARRGAAERDETLRAAATYGASTSRSAAALSVVRSISYAVPSSENRTVSPSPTSRTVPSRSSTSW